MSEMFVEGPKFSIGQYVKARLHGLCGDDIVIEGEIEAYVEAKPKWTMLSDRFRYKIRGERVEIWESVLAAA